jgi:hypothetical protein
MNYKFIGWKQEGTSDKIWGVIMLSEPHNYGEKFWSGNRVKYCTFWGGRGKKLQTKIFEDWEAKVVGKIREKKNKGYEMVDLSKLDEVYPGFENDLQQTAVWATLSA